MRRGGWLTLLLCALSSGCFTPDGERRAAQLAPKQFFEHELKGNDVVHLYVALVEKPVGDPAMNHAAWTLINEHVVDSERQGLLRENGFRLGYVGGSPPPALAELLQSERCCANPRHVQMRAGNPTTIHLGPSWAQCNFRVMQDGRGSPVELGQAACQFEVVPTLAEGGQVKLRFTPLVKHGEVKGFPRVARTPSGEREWELSVTQDVESYPWLGWDVTLEPADTLVVGTMPETNATLGQRCFVHTESAKPVQRLLVLRVGRALPEPDPETGSNDGDPLALQAGRSARLPRP